MSSVPHGRIVLRKYHHAHEEPIVFLVRSTLETSAFITIKIQHILELVNQKEQKIQLPDTEHSHSFVAIQESRCLRASSKNGTD